jgi:transcriptional regulator with GAF, ATPase, and Fis domain
MTKRYKDSGMIEDLLLEKMEALGEVAKELINRSYIIDELITILARRIDETIPVKSVIAIIQELQRRTGSPEFEIPRIKPISDFDVKENERNMIIAALRKTDGVQKEAAKLLNWSPRRLHYKIHHIHKIKEFKWRK